MGSIHPVLEKRLKACVVARKASEANPRDQALGAAWGEAFRELMRPIPIVMTVPEPSKRTPEQEELYARMMKLGGPDAVYRRMMQLGGRYDDWQHYL